MEAKGTLNQHHYTGKTREAASLALSSRYWHELLVCRRRAQKSGQEECQFPHLSSSDCGLLDGCLRTGRQAPVLQSRAAVTSGVDSTLMTRGFSIRSVVGSWTPCDCRTEWLRTKKTESKWRQRSRRWLILLHHILGFIVGLETQINIQTLDKAIHLINRPQTGNPHSQWKL